ncbi:MAG: VOC family protein [Cognatishimia sp.]|uniref:VOC family protein n=1 Tax=Cognatishimia sp. 1_MG-2023 TaxID=3062642 RepID=UPI0026E48A4F|nr:VOC family protein [Cognatishimia sp. 1_MG-2023]MDO6727561.1 VOC family protein [Cognatishimia sp. 1_MG-2023]
MIFRYSILYVDDVPATVAFYQKAFSLELGFLHEGGDYAELKTGDTKLAFSSTALMTQLGKSPAKADPKHPTFEIAFEIDDVATALKTALAAGATLVQDAREEPWGQTTSYVSDPNGYLIEICSPVANAG